MAKRFDSACYMSYHPLGDSQTVFIYLMATQENTRIEPKWLVNKLN